MHSHNNAVEVTPNFLYCTTDKASHFSLFRNFTYFASFVFGGTGGLLPGLSESVVFINSVSVFEY